MKNKIFLLPFIILLYASSSYAQQNMVLHNLNFMPQGTYANPSVLPNDRLSIGLPLISNSYFSAYNNSFTYRDLIHKGSNDSLMFDMNNVISKLKDNSSLNFQMQTDLLFVGLRFKRSYIMFNVSEKAEVQFNLSKDFVDFFWNGNAPTVGTQKNLSLGLNLNHYREYGLYYARSFFGKLNVGFRYKLLFGMENLQVNSSNLGIYTDPNSYAITVNSNVDVNSAGLSTVDIRNFKNYLFSTANKGTAFDIGASYQITPRWTVDASLIDFGRINWSRDAKNFRTADPNATYSYLGSPIQSVVNDSTKATGIINDVLDSVQNSFRVKESSTTYTTKLNPTIFVSGRYSINQFFFASAIIQARKKFDSWTPTFGLAVNGRLGSIFDLAVHYTYNKDISHNFGGGLIFYFGNASLMLLSDNISGAIRYRDTRFLNVRMGAAFHFGKYFVDKDKDDDDIPDDEDKCPTVAGPPETNGCPDTDGDKIIDIEDDCPKEAGPKTLNGCPDRDNDGIIDKFDDCPEIAGEAEMKGCPDKDHDGIMDIDDKCPLDAGTKEMKGCPDRDGDGIGDGDDLCPDKKGLSTNNGCPPDADNDGVADEDDKCPDLPGEVQSKGCPNTDTDGDGIFDKDDECIFTKGTAENNGCPAFADSEAVVIRNAAAAIAFDNQSTDLNASSIAPLEALAAFLNSKEELIVKVAAHTDNEGSETAKMKLSEERALAVKQFLVSKGVNPLRITCSFFGGTKPIGDNSTPEGRKQNNRVELQVKYK